MWRSPCLGSQITVHKVLAQCHALLCQAEHADMKDWGTLMASSLVFERQSCIHVVQHKPASKR